MNTKKIVLVVLIILIVLFLIGLLIYFLLVQAPKIVNRNINLNLNLAPEVVDPYKMVKDARSHIAKIIDQKINYDTYYELLEFLTFCNVKEDKKPYFAECSNVFNLYLYDPSADREEYINKWCRRDSYLALIYFLKQDQKDMFMQVCNDYKATNLLVLDCNQAWETKLYADNLWCDDKGLELCWPILEGSDAKTMQERYWQKASAPDSEGNIYTAGLPTTLESCAAKDGVKINEVNLSDVKNLKCKNEIPFRKASKIEDCEQTDDAFTKLLCLAEFDNNICTEFQNNFTQYKLSELLAKYKIKDCCLETNGTYTDDLQ